MSFAKPKPENPAVKFIEFKGDTGKFQYYKKSLTENERGENIEIPLPIKLIVIDELSTITGFNDKNQCGIYSNEVHNITKEPLSVRLFKSNEGAIGFYKDIKGIIQSLGGKFTKSVYALIVENGETELVNFKAKGSFLNAWIEKKVNPDTQGIVINDCLEKTKGKTVYYEPVIEGFTVPDIDKTRRIALKYYNILHDYFEAKKNYFEEQQAAKEQEDNANTFNEDGNYTAGDTDDNLPF